MVGEILAGILLGPTLFDGAVSGTLFPADVRAPLTGLADVGVALFVFIVGWRSTPRPCGGGGGSASPVSARVPASG
ncbi:hypothetical protein [Streptomyces sp. Ac-502]|uniref:hypothetical protein n=1 Tax=Streptomyces sp. Ac-502 TaxID=3342801 RepID=UPI00386229D7